MSTAAEPLRIVPAASRGEMKAFIAVPRLVYGGMAGFAAPLDMERAELIDPRHGSFHKHGEAKFWIAYRGTRPVGRISAQIDHAGDRKAGLFGCLDAAEDAAAVAALLGTAEDWLRGQGCTDVTGPYTLSINGETGMLLEGHDEPAMVLMPWHPRYLPGLVAAAGYEEARRVESFSLNVADFDGDAKFAAFAGASGAAITIRELRLDRLAEEAEIARDLFNDAWAENWGFVPLQKVDMQAMVKGFKPFLFKECAAVAELDGKPICLALAVPNIAELNAGLGGRPSPLGWLKIAWRVLRPRYRSARMILFGLRREYRASLAGLAAIMKTSGAMINGGRRLGVATLEAGWVLDNNHQVLRMLRSVGFRRCRVYGIYRKPLL